ncbi:hypothetical protein PoB_004305400 [Plakobranchus ocellatus]|uniref:Secreted protein n=1 Tax=Plakobranchus ocellatus TaxID=259542 RepID=A0AAV4B8W3_9GAST|nr:hypothetical protein PoB_004305400 [Plakobranchus ocellatus]
MMMMMMMMVMVVVLLLLVVYDDDDVDHDDGGGGDVSPWQDDLRFSGLKLGQGAGDGARTPNKKFPADFRACSLSTPPSMPLWQDDLRFSGLTLDDAPACWCVGGIGDSKPSLSSAWMLPSRLRVPPLTPWTDGSLKARDHVIDDRL